MSGARYILLALSGLGVVCLHVFSSSNGFFDACTNFSESRVFYDGVSFKNNTGIKPMDELLSFLLPFFWPLCDGRHPALTLHSILFAAQFIAAWTITMAENVRSGSPGYLVAVFGLIFQTVGAAVTIPAALAIHLFWKKPGRALLRDGAGLKAIPCSIAIGFILPSVIMGLPSPEILTAEQKILAISIWQPFPLWVAMIHFVLRRCMSSSNNQRAIRGVYLFALAVAVPFHIAIVGMSVFASVSPGLFNPAFVSELQMGYFLIPPNPLSKTGISDFAEGAFYFIQFDYAISAVAYLVWAAAITDKDDVAGNRTMVGIVKGLIRVLLLGPMAAALLLVWERDEAVLGNAKPSQRKLQ